MLTCPSRICTTRASMPCSSRRVAVGRPGGAGAAGGRVFLGEQRPIAIERTRVEEADAAVIGLEGTARDTALIPQMQKIGANLLLVQQIGRALIVGREPADRLDVDVPGPLGKAGKAHVFDHTLTQRGHGLPPLGLIGQDLCPGTPTDTPAPPSTAKPFSPTAAEASKRD